MNKTRKTVTLMYLKVYSLVCVMQRLSFSSEECLEIKKTPPQPHPLSIYCFTAHVIEVVAGHCVLYIFTKSICAMEDWASFSVNQRTWVHEDVHMFCPACILVHWSKRMGQGMSCQCLP